MALMAQTHEPPTSTLASTPPARPQPKRCDKADVDLVERLFTRDSRGYIVIDKSLIQQVVAKRADVIEPLLEKIAKNTSLDKAVGGIFAKMDPSPLPILLDIHRRYPGYSVRVSLVYLLCEGGSQSRMRLTKMLKSPDSHVRSLALDTLRQTSKRSITMTRELEQLLFGALKDSSPDVRQAAPAAIARQLIDNDAMTTTLIDVMKNSPWGGLRVMTVHAMYNLVVHWSVGAADVKQIIDGLTWTLLNDSSVHVRVAAAKCLGEIGPKAKSAAAALLKASDHKNHKVRTAARKALDRSGMRLSTSLLKAGADDEAIALILELRATNFGVGQAVRDKLVKLGPGNLAAMMEIPRICGTNFHWKNVSQVIAGWDARVADKLDSYVDDENWCVRRTVAAAWGQMASIDELPKNLHKLLHDGHSMVRATLVESLVLWSKRDSPKLRKAVLPLLTAAMWDESIQYRHQHPMWERMEKLAPDHPEIIDEMIRVTKTSISGTVRSHAVISLGRIGRSLPPDHKGLGRIVGALSASLRDDGDSLVTHQVITVLRGMGPRARLALPELQKLVATSNKYLVKRARDAIVKIKAES